MQAEKLAAQLARQNRVKTSTIPFKLEQGFDGKLKFTLQNPMEFALDTSYRRRGILYIHIYI